MTDRPSPLDLAREIASRPENATRDPKTTGCAFAPAPPSPAWKEQPMPDALTRLADAAAPGPWHVEQRAAAPRPLVLTDDDDVVCMAFPNDARLITLAPDLARVASQLAETLAKTIHHPPGWTGRRVWWAEEADNALAAYRALLDRAEEEA